MHTAWSGDGIPIKCGKNPTQRRHCVHEIAVNYLGPRGAARECLFLVACIYAIASSKDKSDNGWYYIIWVGDCVGGVCSGFLESVLSQMSEVRGTEIASF